MTLKAQLIIYIVSVAGAFAAGRSLFPVAKTTDSKSSLTEQKDMTTTKDTKEVVTTTETSKPNGEKVVTVVDNIDTHEKTGSADSIKSAQDNKVVESKKSTIHLQLLGGADMTSNFKLVYGGMVSKQFIGPVTLGVFGLSDGTLGLSIGLEF